ncbi:MAG: hypothetical protein RL148_380 [Planctomycetota bacterium]
MAHVPSVLSAAFLLAALAGAQSHVNFESGQVQPMRLTPDGRLLLVADTTNSRLSVFDLRQPSLPQLVAEIPVGLEPVSVNARTNDEVWVVNQVGDSVSIVSLALGVVVDTIRVKDEPSDVVFAGGKAFVTAATTDQVHVFDAATRVPLGVVEVFGKDPRSLAVSPNGAKVYAVVQRSGNGTTIIPFNAPGMTVPSLPPGSTLPTPPRAGRIVRADDPQWLGTTALPTGFSLPDNDVVEIDVASLTVSRNFRRVGTINTGIAVHPTTGDLWVANTEARNLVSFEFALKGHAVDNRVTRITTGATPTVTPVDLNPGVNYATMPNPAAQATALADPFGVAVDAASNRIYVAAQGSDRIGVLDGNGAVVGRIDVRPVGAGTRQMRGPRALVLHPTTGILYVHNRMTDTVGVVDRAAGTLVREVAIATHDPVPATLREGRKFLYDARLSGAGAMSCASCHVDGDTDGIAWDLGDPYGVMEPIPTQPQPFDTLFLLSATTPIGRNFHPMKGPMTTQTFKGLAATNPLHWRGDRSNFQAFNGAFVTLMGLSNQIPTADMNDYAAFATSIAFPPNPNQLLTRTLRSSPAGNNEAAGLAAYNQVVQNILIIGDVSCVRCHSLPTGTNRAIVEGPQTLEEPQHMKVPQLRNMYRKTGFNRTGAPQKSGFGFTHDGSLDTLTSFFAQPVFDPWPAATKDDIVTFLRSFDTGTGPLVGYQATMTSATVGSATLNNDLTLLTGGTTGTPRQIDLVALGVLDGRQAGLLYRPGTADFASDRTGEGPFTLAQLQARVQQGGTRLTFLGVPPGSGTRMALDRDLDGALNGDEAAQPYGIATAGCSGAPLLAGNSEPRIGNGLFGFVMANAPASAGGFLLQSFAQASVPLVGITVNVDPATASVSFVQADAAGTGLYGLPVPNQPSLVGVVLRAQVGWFDPCGTQGFSGSRGLAVTVRQ